jgi:hypothetical protein
VEQTEVEKQISDLEVAVDRLRSLYEQYFVGIEKLEPQVPRKDVDRKIHALRREQIRNTALRFRFQMVLQRYNTYQTHWQRVCREIENGTYKRHLVRAQRRFGAGTSTRPPPRRSSAPPPLIHPDPGAPLAPDLQAQLPELDRDVAPSPPAALPPMAASGRPSLPPRPGALAPPPLPPRAHGAPAPTPGPPAFPRPAVSGAPPAMAARPTIPGAPAVSGAPPAPVWRKIGVPGGPGGPGASLPPTAARSIAVPAPLVSRPPAAVGATTAPAAPRAPAVIPPRPAAAPTLTTQTTTPRPPQPPPTRVPVPAREPTPLPAPARGPQPSEERIRQLYSDLVETKRKQNESTAAITYQSVAKSILESSDRLHKKHGRSVDFEVTVKDGKAVLRPVIK